MRKVCSLAAVALLVGSAASANDAWTGWYVGGYAGTGSGDSQADVSLGGRWSIEDQSLRDFVSEQWSTELDASGSMFGVQFGYRHQLEGGLVLGAELDYSSLSVDDSRQTGPLAWPDDIGLSYAFANRIEANDMVSIRPFIGLAFDNSLVFLTAGWASVDIDASAEVLSNGNYSKLGESSESLSGVRWGVGYEYAFGNQWSVRAEYLMTDLDDFDYDTEYRPGSSFTDPAYLESVSQDLDLDMFRLAVNFAF